MKLVKYSYVFFIVFIFLGCQITTSQVEDLDSQKKCEIVISHFYTSLIKEQYRDSYKLFADSFFTKIDTSKLDSFYRKNASASGGVKGYLMVDFQQKRSLTNINAINCVAIYRVERSGGFTNERIILKIVDNAMPKILRYNVDTSH
ncbi:hypothetical protein H9X96_22285 [Pedobacter sp. N36a]|uniref:hypothetical protein n=1 Tax=Pedobacter sp. N36a TaxID=2767996 RepID=UPI001656B58B|nr:hypothetical protein [Pedobacter sp. N36a]MBC8988482.1 hypothetical protein [Pedobacter sp. N36a]